MYTIKINVFDVKDEKGRTERVFKQSFYIEGMNLKVKFFDSSKDNFDDEIKKICDYWIINPKTDPFIMCLMGYIDSKNEYKQLVIYNAADVYIMQNGKTIDKISI